MNEELENKELSDLLKQLHAPECLNAARRAKIFAALPSEKQDAQRAERDVRLRIWHGLVKYAAIVILVVGVLAGLLMPASKDALSIARKTMSMHTSVETTDSSGWSTSGAHAYDDGILEEETHPPVGVCLELCDVSADPFAFREKKRDRKLMSDGPPALGGATANFSDADGKDRQEAFESLEVEWPKDAEGKPRTRLAKETHPAPPPASSPLSPRPAKMDSVAIVKSPIVMRGIVGSRSSGQRGNVLQRWVRKRELPTLRRAVAEEEPSVEVRYEIVDGEVIDRKTGAKLVVKVADEVVEPEVEEKPTGVDFGPFMLIPTAQHPLSTFGLDTDTAGYTRSAMLIASGVRPDPGQIRQEEFINAFEYGDTAPTEAAFRIYIEGAWSPFRSANNLLRVGVKGRRLGREEKRSLMLTILLDSSGSMETPERMPLARKAILALLAKLPDGDSVTILTCSDRTRKLFSGSAWENPATFQSAEKQLNEIRCQGATNLEDGIVKAFESAASDFKPHGENRVVIISDGIANLGSGNATEILKRVSENRGRGIRCSVIGVGRSSYNDTLLEAMANRGDGQYSFLDSEQSIDESFVNDLENSFNTIASDVKIQVEWNRDVVEAYKSHGYDSRALRDEQFRDDTVDAGEVGSGQGVTVVYEMKLTDSATAAAVLGTVRIRYRRTDNGVVEEIEKTITRADVMRDFRTMRPQFRLACAVAEFATVLKHRPAAAQASALKDVAASADVVALELGYYKPAKEFAETVRRLMGLGL